MANVSPSILSHVRRLALPNASAPTTLRPELLRALPRPGSAQALGPLALGPLMHGAPAAPMGGFMPASAAPRDLSMNATGSGETLVIVLAVGAAAAAAAYAAGVWPFKGSRKRAR